MIHQTKVLKTLLRRLNITDHWGDLRVRTVKNKHHEYGKATAHVRGLTAYEISALKTELPYIKIFNYPTPGEGGYSFAIIEY